MATFKHNKKRNTGLIYEFLVRRLSTAMVEQDKTTYARTLEILKKYYSEGTILAEEKELFEVIKNTRGVSENAARRILKEVQKHARNMDFKKLEIKKSNLLKDINYSFGREFFGEHRIPEYRLLASIQMVVDGSRGDAMLTESVAEIQLEEGLIQYMITKGDYTVKPAATQSEVDQLVMKMVSKRFEEKYSATLNPSQRTLLEKYIRSQVTGDEQPLRKEIAAQSSLINEKLVKATTMKEVIEDKAMLQKLSEAKEHFAGMGAGSIDKMVEEVMVYQKLVEEIDSNE